MAYDDDFAFPQDLATGLQEQVDWVDAGAFAFLSHHPNITGYVVDGLEFEPDWANNLLTVTAGKAAIYQSNTLTNDHRDDGGPDEKTLEGAMFTVQRPPSGDLNLLADETNYVYLDVDQTERDTTAYVLNTTQTAPSEPYLYLGRVDTAAEVAYEENRYPTTTTSLLHVTGETHAGKAARD